VKTVVPDLILRSFPPRAEWIFEYMSYEYPTPVAFTGLIDIVLDVVVTVGLHGFGFTPPNSFFIPIVIGTVDTVPSLVPP